MKYAIGIDVGGTTVASGIVNHHGDLIQKVIIDSDPTDKEKMFDCVVTSVNKLLTHSSIPLDQIYGIGAGVPGKIDREKGIAVYQNNLPWDNFPFVQRIQEVFHVERVVMDNDVYMAAFAEWKEAGLKDELFVYLTISTGIATSIINGGQFIRGAGFAGELGLIPVFAPHHEEGLARLEKVASGPAIEKFGKEQFMDQTISSKKVFDAYYAGDPKADSLIDEVTTSIAHGVYMINSLLDPHQIMMGGSVATRNPALLHHIKEKLATYLLDEQKHILDHMAISTLGNEQGIIGAGLRVFDTFHD
ncbi:ROK family protein [Virgibacillus soli]|uniref:ROK family protein n=1 Tax=Paracerasibacillus soli TaxID=480284 RepID=A0ABU5CS83_9BACI|nr:ROK family protein [Virgibacillus soli]MDY0409236.1 ROK family protein [Virgibacillus soli]